jgi:hypothetical protein
VNQPSREGFEIVDTVLGDSAGMLGAAALISSFHSFADKGTA